MDNIAKEKCMKLSQTTKEFLAEMMGTFILLMFGIGSVAQVTLGGSNMGGMLSINFGWGMGVIFGVYWSAGVSGGHINPAVTLGMVVAGRMPLKKLPVYWAGQFVGAIIASAVVFAVYSDLLMAHDPTKTVSSAWIWTTAPGKGVSTATTFGDQLVGTCLLVSTIFALTDKKNNAPSAQLLPVCVGLLVVGIGISFGANVGYGINPARDLGPRIFVAIAGWGKAPFAYQNYFFWAPVLGQLLGGVIGAILYVFAVEAHHVNYKDEQIPLKNKSFNAEDSPGESSYTVENTA